MDKAPETLDPPLAIMQLNGSFDPSYLPGNAYVYQTINCQFVMQKICSLQAQTEIPVECLCHTWKKKSVECLFYCHFTTNNFKEHQMKDMHCFRSTADSCKHHRLRNAVSPLLTLKHEIEVSFTFLLFRLSHISQRHVQEEGAGCVDGSDPRPPSG